MGKVPDYCAIHSAYLHTTVRFLRLGTLICNSQIQPNHFLFSYSLHLLFLIWKMITWGFASFNFCIQHE